jgi:hypothetical protein
MTRSEAAGRLCALLYTVNVQLGDDRNHTCICGVENKEEEFKDERALQYIEAAVRRALMEGP